MLGFSPTLPQEPRKAETAPTREARKILASKAAVNCTDIGHHQARDCLTDLILSHLSSVRPHTMAPWDPTKNKTYQILKAAEEGGYGVVAPIAYNLEHVLAFIAAAEAKRAPLIIQVFPWAITFSKGLLIHAAALAATQATVPVAIHLDHAQDEAMIRSAADSLPFDSIMVDMSHYEMDENLAKTKVLVEYCHERGIATEAEPGRIEGGEDGIADTADLEGALTTPEQVEDFIATGIDFLAPAFGNVHGDYGKRGPVLDFDR